ncbi:MAG: class I SAM-dependent methyltransferase [Chloroflexi bacterium]|nr:class I SAM-dependent methyltransferase [Chloroflexota bacterium]
MTGARFFRTVQDAPWYAHFLQPVLDGLPAQPPGAAVLDVGTGAGKLLELGQTLPHLRWQGADTEAAMLAEARKRPSLRQTPLHHLTPHAPLPFPDAQFDAVTFCSVLFLLPDPTPLLAEAWRILRPNGRLIALTPSGSKGTPGIMRTIGWHAPNWSFFLWRQMTARNGRRWAQQETLANFARQHGAAYEKQSVFHDLATVEWVQRAKT